MKDATFSHFRSLFAKREVWNIYFVNGLISRKINKNDNLALQRMILEEEVELALSQYNLEIAPRVDKLNVEALKFLWHSIKDNMMKIIYSFIENG